MPIPVVSCSVETHCRAGHWEGRTSGVSAALQALAATGHFPEGLSGGTNMCSAFMCSSSWVKHSSVGNETLPYIHLWTNLAFFPPYPPYGHLWWKVRFTWSSRYNRELLYLFLSLGALGQFWSHVLFQQALSLSVPSPCAVSLPGDPAHSFSTLSGFQ